MGLFSRKKNKIEPVDIPKPSRPSDSFTIKQSDDGLQIDFCEAVPKFGQFYDTTRLILQGKNINFPDKQVYDCLVSWYGQSDAIMLDPDSGEMISGRRDTYIPILAQIDLNLLQTDSAYLKAVMQSLLNESRVNRYKDMGMKTPEEIAKARAEGNTSLDLCGRYVGGIRVKDGNYQKFFDVAVGKKAHNLPEMIQARQELKESRERARQNEIKSKQAEVAKLKARISELEAESEVEK